jgi:hypothetical protein
MKLPKIDVPTYELVLPSNKKKIVYRPFLVKEEKILLMALAGDDNKEIVNATKQIVNNCLVSEVDIDHLTSFDVEYLFVNLRAKSIGEKVKIVVFGDENSDCENCKKDKMVEINLNEVEVKEFDDHSKKIEITDKIGIIMKYPTIDMIDKIHVLKSQETKEDIEDYFTLIAQCIESVYNEDEIATSIDTPDTIKLLKDWVENSLRDQHLEQINKFFETMPKVQQTLKTTCPKCSKKDEILLEDLQRFFA